MNIKVIIAPSEEPVTLSEAKAFLRVDGTSDDTLITSLIKAARESGEEISRRAFVTQTLEEVTDIWRFYYDVARPPLQSVAFVKYKNASGAESTWTDYIVNTQSEPGVIIFNTLPGETLLACGAITTRFVAGYGAAANVPQRIKNAILALVSYWYESRETGNVPKPLYDSFLADRVAWF